MPCLSSKWLSTISLNSQIFILLWPPWNRQLINSDSSGVLRLFLVQGHVPVSGRVSPQFPYWGEVSLLCHSVPLTLLQGILQYTYIMYKMADLTFKCIFFRRHEYCQKDHNVTSCCCTLASAPLCFSHSLQLW